MLLETKYEVGSEVKERLQRGRRTRERRKEHIFGGEEERRMGTPRGSCQLALNVSPNCANRLFYENAGK